MHIARPETPLQARLLRLLRDRGPQARGGLAEVADLSRTRLGAELDRLAVAGLLEVRRSDAGRHSATVDLHPDLRFLGVDVGATSVDVGVTDGRLRLLGRRGRELDVREGPAVVLDAVVALWRELRAEGRAVELHGAGIGLPGPVASDEGVPVAPPLMPGWDRYPVRDHLVRALGCTVVVDNDVNVLALGEHHAGAARGVDDVLFVKLGTGVGAAVFLGGRPYRGATGSAGDVGHLGLDDSAEPCPCGARGCVEAVVSGAALARTATAAARSGASPVLARRLAAAGRVTARDVAAAATEADPEAVRLVRESGRRVGRLLATLVSFANPGLVVLCGGMTGLGHTLLAEVRAEVYRRSPPLATGDLPIVLSELGTAAGLVGGARLVSDHLFAA
nr:ROK family protein [Vallicoccus soli]